MSELLPGGPQKPEKATILEWLSQSKIIPQLLIATFFHMPTTAIANQINYSADDTNGKNVSRGVSDLLSVASGYQISEKIINSAKEHVSGKAGPCPKQLDEWRRLSLSEYTGQVTSARLAKELYFGLTPVCPEESEGNY